MAKLSGCGKCQICSEKQSRKRKMLPLFSRTPTDPQAGLGAPSLGCAHVELPLPLVRSAQLPPPTTSLLHLCFKTRLLTTISPPYPFPRSHRRKQNTNLFLKPCFSTINCSGADRCLARFLSSIHERRRGRNAHVNTGNDTNDQKKEIENKSKVSCMKMNL